jgi:plasmid stabilization system protein ParE
MAFRIRWTLPAADDFENLAKKIEQDSDLVESQKVAREIFKSIEGLVTHPHIGEKLGDYPQLRRRLASSFKIIYQVFEAEEVVEIGRILHERQDLKTHLTKRPKP